MSERLQAEPLPSAIERLAASRPFPPQERDLALYGRLVGAWDVDWAAFDESGAVAERRRAEWHFAWVLGGRAVQDVIWRVGEPPENDGTTLRCWDPELGAWRAVFMSPGDGEYVSLVGRPDGEGIVQHVAPLGDGPGDARAERRWRFSSITDSGFLWQSETSPDGGRSWTVTHEMRARRRSGP
jgi:hypothetical protein